MDKKTVEQLQKYFMENTSVDDRHRYRLKYAEIKEKIELGTKIQKKEVD